MPVSREEILAQIDDVLASVEGFTSDQPGHEEVTRLAAAIERLAPMPSQYRARANQTLTSGMFDKFKVFPLAATLRVLRTDVEKGYTRTVEELVHAEVFEDFLSMAEELHGKGFDAAAAVLAGSVLEGHLRKLADKEGVPPNQSFDQLGIALVKQGTLKESERKICAGWYGQRTEGAHGHPENVVSEEVGRMIPGVRDFLVRYPA